VALEKLESGKCTFWESCLDGGEGGLQGLVVGMRGARVEQREPEVRARTERTARTRGVENKEVRGCCFCFECFV
jgi:hypothetical protein